jgi:N-acetyl sugar amidotransferase
MATATNGFHPVRSYQQCTRCVMDTSDPEISFDSAGRCHHCAQFLRTRSKYGYSGAESDHALEQLVDDIKAAGKGRQYDCVIGVSGGVDSSFLAYTAKDLGLRALAVHMDNGWDSELAVTNIMNVVTGLGFDYQSYVLDWEEFRDLQLAFLRASVPEAETPTDVAIPAALHHFAAKYDVKYILSGGNLATEGILPKSWHYDAKDERYLRSIHGKFGTVPLKKFPTFGYKKEIYYKLIKGIRIVYPLNHIRFSKERAAELLSTEFGWRDYGGKHHESRYTKFIHTYYLVKKFDIDYRRLGLSLQICEGLISRDEAIEQLKRSPYDPAETRCDMQYIAKKLKITSEELDRLTETPPRWYWQFPNNERKLRFIYNSYRRLYKKEKIDRF